jgi:hypothetical protein
MKNELAPATVALVLVGALVGACDAQVDPGYAGEPLLTLKGRVQAQVGPAEADVGVLWFRSDAQHGCSGPVRSGGSYRTGSYSPDADQACADACGPYLGDFNPEHDRQWESCQRACGVDVTVESFVSYQACVTGAVGQTTPVVGDFPAQFSLDVLLPPPEQALMPSDTGERMGLGYFVALAPSPGSLALSFEKEPPVWLLGGSETHVLAYAADPIEADSSWGLYLGGSYDVGYHLLRVQYGNRCGLPQRYSDEVPFGDPDNGGASGSVDLLPMPDTEPMLAPSSDDSIEPTSDVPASPPEPDYRGVPFVCGNGVCEAQEDCRRCSDCGACETGSPESTGILYGQMDYACFATDNTLRASVPGGEVDIELRIAPPELISWPSL